MCIRDRVKGVVLPVAGLGLIQQTAAGTRSIVDQINIMGQFVFGKNAGRPFALPAAADMGGFCERLIKIAASDDIVALAIFSLHQFHQLAGLGHLAFAVVIGFQMEVDKYQLCLLYTSRCV